MSSSSKLSSNSGSGNVSEFSVGDLFYILTDKQYNVYKLLSVDTDFGCYHILSYLPLDRPPLPSDISNLSVFVYHSPFDMNVFADAVLLANTPIRSADLIGYHEYLRQTQEPDYYIPIANGYYQSGLQLTNEKKLDEAIDAYSKAMDLFPSFFEAIDNRAFCKMDMGLWTEAIADFSLSLQQNSESLLAEFSIGECFFNMADFQNAKRHFERAHQIDPDHQAPKQFLDKVNALSDGKKTTK